MKTRDTRQVLLDAAEQIVQRDGVARLTLDAVAYEAHVSKGCLLYYFPSKSALIEGMKDDLISRFESEHARYLQTDPGGLESPGSWLRAFVRATLAVLPNNTPMGKTSAAIFAASANDPALLKSLQDRFDLWQTQIEQCGVDTVTANMVRLTVEGLWFTELFGFAPPCNALRDQVIERLLTFTELPNPRRP